jgi:hypothetical protein
MAVVPDDRDFSRAEFGKNLSLHTQERGSSFVERRLFCLQRVAFRPGSPQLSQPWNLCVIEQKQDVLRPALKKTF